MASSRSSRSTSSSTRSHYYTDDDRVSSWVRDISCGGGLPADAAAEGSAATGHDLDWMDTRSRAHDRRVHLWASRSALLPERRAGPRRTSWRPRSCTRRRRAGTGEARRMWRRSWAAGRRSGGRRRATHGQGGWDGHIWGGVERICFVFSDTLQVGGYLNAAQSWRRRMDQRVLCRGSAGGRSRGQAMRGDRLRGQLSQLG